MNELYSRLAELCSQKGVTGYRFCKDTGLQPSFLTDLKFGRQSGVGARKASVIAKYFNVSTDYILYGKEKEPTTDGKLSFEESELLRCWNEATLEEREAVAFALRRHGMPFPKNQEQPQSGHGIA